MIYILHHNFCCFSFEYLYTLMCLALLLATCPIFFAVLCREELAPFSAGWGLGLGLLRVLD